MVDRSPQVHAFAGDPDDNFVEVPSAVRGGSAAAQLVGDLIGEQWVIYKINGISYPNTH